MKVSVLISAFNRAQWLGETIHSVLQSTYQDIEIVVRNSSNPECFEAVDRIASLDWRRNGEAFKVKLIHGINKNPPHSGNMLLREASGEYIMLLPDDDLIDPDLIERLVALMPDCELACCQPRFIDAEGKPKETDDTWTHITPIVNMERQAMKQAMYRGTPFVGGIMFRRSLIDRIGFANETLFNLSDLDFYLRVLEVGEIKVIEEPLYSFRLHGNNTSLVHSEHHERLEDELRRIRRRHFGKPVSNCDATLDVIASLDPMARLGWATK